jgi:hypothetical protein
MKFSEFDPKRNPKKHESKQKLVYPAVPAQPALFLKKNVEDQDEAVEKNIIIKVN